MQVPEWNTYYPSLSSATKKQKEFYSELVSALEKGKKIEIEENLSYIFVYLYKSVKEFVKRKKIEPLINKFERIYKFYGSNEKISLYISAWLKDAFLYISDFDNAWIYLKEGKCGSIEDIIYVRGNCTETDIRGEEILQILGSQSGLTKFGNENIEQVTELISIFLKDFHFENKINYTEYFLKQFDYGNITEEDFEELKEYYTNESDYQMWYSEYKKTQNSKYPYPKQYHHYLFAGAPLTTPYFKRDTIPYIVSVALHNKFKEIIRESENTVRSEKNLPLVGEGWISETELYYKIHNEFQNEKVVHHGKPLWLKRQHLDIYFPNKNIGIEYQGVQHQKPVDFFGGEESFKKQQRLDKKKQKLCKDNGCDLIYVFENYDFEDVISKIKSAL
ncbi:hypothetical protein [Psychroflexus torquis]|nr:hypothetical protein [Psychroflexus torquis]